MCCCAGDVPRMSTEARGRGHDGEAPIHSLELPNLSTKPGQRGGTFDLLQHDATLAPGHPAPSVEGWVVLLTNLAPNVKEDDVKDLVNGFQDLPVVRMNPSAQTCMCVGHAFVEFANFDSAKQAIAQLQGSLFFGRAINLGFAFLVPSAGASTESVLEARANAALAAQANAAGKRSRQQDADAEEDGQGKAHRTA